MRGTRQRGAALVDVMCAAGLVAVVSSIAVPVLNLAREHHAARSAARYLASRFQHARFEAIKRNAAVALRIDADDLDRMTLYIDGDGDGVLESDIQAGRDTALGPETRLSDYTGPIRLRVNQDVIEPDSGVTLSAGSDPLRVGQSTLLSFSPLGSSTSGTVYLAGPGGPQMAVRIFGATGRMRVLRFDTASGQSRED